MIGSTYFYRSRNFFRDRGDGDDVMLDDDGASSSEGPLNDVVGGASVACVCMSSRRKDLRCNAFFPRLSINIALKCRFALVP